MNHRRIAGMALSMLMLMETAGCGQKQETAQDYRAEAESLYQTCAAKEDCCLCGSGAALYWEHLGENNVGIVDLENAKLYPIKENVIAFQAGDYYIHCDSRETDRDGNPLKMSVYVVYTPLRYGEEKAE